MEVMETSGSRALGSDAVQSISARLSLIDDLYFPRALHSAATDPSQRKTILSDLLLRDVPVFLERYGSQLTFNELHIFDVLKDNYEVNWHLKHLRSIISPTSDELRSRSVTVKNRRRAYLNKLIFEGQYFSEDAMREREPYLHHEYVGKFHDPSGRSMARPGERWSETLMRRTEEAILVAKIRGEQQKLGVAERDWIGNNNITQEEVEEEEEEEDEKEDEEEEEKQQKVKEKEEEAKKDDTPADSSHSAESVGQARPDATNDVQSFTEGSSLGGTLSAEEMQDQMDQFTSIMQEKFLLGEDFEHLDYSKIDNDQTLDDYWQREVNDDAEEKYFDEG